MTTDTDNTIAAAEVWRAIGRLESDTATLKDGQSEIKADLEADLHLLDQRVVRPEGDTATLSDTLKEGQSEIRAEFKRLNDKLDKMLYDLIAGGSVLFVAILASNFIGN